MIKGTRYYAYDDGVHGTELWFDDGRHPPAMLADLYPGAASSLPDDLALVNGRLVFAATTPDAGRELYWFEPISRPSRTATGLIPELPMSDRSDAILSLIFAEPVQSAGAVGLF